MSKKDLQAAEYTWDHFDVDLIRRVAWSSLKQVSDSTQPPMPVGYSITSYIHKLLKDNIDNSQTSEASEVVGCAIACGDMSAERYFFEMREFVGFTRVHGFDLSSESLKRAFVTGVEFIGSHVDCNNIILEDNSYDLIVGHQGLHHVENLGNIFYQAHRSLKSRGYLFLSEWIGPDYLQIPYANRIISIILLYLLFPSRAVRTTHMGLVKGLNYLQPLPISFDPSEACNSNNLEMYLRRYFKYHSIKYAGGLCYPIFEGIAQNLSESSRVVKIKIAAVIFIEKWLTRLKIVRPLFINAICEKTDLKITK